MYNCMSALLHPYLGGLPRKGQDALLLLKLRWFSARHLCIIMPLPLLLIGLVRKKAEAEGQRGQAEGH